MWFLSKKRKEKNADQRTVTETLRKCAANLKEDFTTAASLSVGLSVLLVFLFNIAGNGNGEDHFFPGFLYTGFALMFTFPVCLYLQDKLPELLKPHIRANLLKHNLHGRIHEPEVVSLLRNIGIGSNKVDLHFPEQDRLDLSSEDDPEEKDPEGRKRILHIARNYPELMDYLGEKPYPLPFTLPAIRIGCVGLLLGTLAVYMMFLQHGGYSDYIVPAVYWLKASIGGQAATYFLILLGMLFFLWVSFCSSICVAAHFESLAELLDSEGQSA